jgi:hypothetical protein
MSSKPRKDLESFIAKRIVMAQWNVLSCMTSQKAQGALGEKLRRSELAIDSCY